MQPIHLPKRILVPTDFSEGASAALAYAIDLAKPFSARVTLLHSYSIPAVGSSTVGFASMGDWLQEIIDAAQKALDAAVAEHAGSGVPIVGVLRQDDARDGILAVAESLSADLIVMGTHGRQGLSRLVLGSVAESVVRHSAVPVLTVRVPSQASV